MPSKTFLLIHGAWHGGWCWAKVVRALEAYGHRAIAPTMAGLGDRRELLSADLTFDALVDDLHQHISGQELEDVVLVGHSFGGAVASAINEQLGKRVSTLVYLDAALLEHGESMFSNMSPELVEQRQVDAQSANSGLAMSVPSMAQLGIVSKTLWHQISHFLTPHPFASYETPISLQRPPGAQTKTKWIECNHPVYEPLDWARQRARAYGWDPVFLNTGHCPMLTEPGLLAEVLDELA